MADALLQLNADTGELHGPAAKGEERNTTVQIEYTVARLHCPHCKTHTLV